MGFNIKLIILIIMSMISYINTDNPFICPSTTNDMPELYTIEFEDKKFDNKNFCGTEFPIQVNYTHINLNIYVGDLYIWIKENTDNDNQPFKYDIKINKTISTYFQIYNKSGSLVIINNNTDMIVYGLDFTNKTIDNSTYTDILDTNVNILVYKNMGAKILSENITNKNITDKKIIQIYNIYNNRHFADMDYNFTINPYNYFEYFDDNYYFKGSNYLSINKIINATLIIFNKDTYVKVPVNDKIVIFKIKLDSNKNSYNIKHLNDSGVYDEIIFTNTNQLKNIMLKINNKKTKRSIQNTIIIKYLNAYRFDEEIYNYDYMSWYIYESNLKKLCDKILDFNKDYCDMNPVVCIKSYLNSSFIIRSSNNYIHTLEKCYDVEITNYFFNESMCYAYIKVEYKYNNIIHIGYYNQKTNEIYNNNIKILCKKSLFISINNELYYVSKQDNYEKKKITDSKIISLKFKNDETFSPYIYNYTFYMNHTDNDIIESIYDMNSILTDNYNTNLENDINDSYLSITDSIDSSYEYIKNKTEHALQPLVNYILNKYNIISFMLLIVIVMSIILFLIYVLYKIKKIIR